MSSVVTILATGLNGTAIEVECHLSNGLPSITIVGLGNKAVDEAKERIRSAFASAQLILPRKRITINLAPADIPKESTSIDLAIAVAIMKTSGQLPANFGDGHAIIGEIGLEGDVRGVRGIIGKLVAGKKLGISNFFVPYANLQQTLLVPDVQIAPIKNIKNIVEGSWAKTYTLGRNPTQPRLPPAARSLSDIAGQAQAKRALEIVAAGGHNILLYGPPGTGKSMLAKALPSLLPPLTHQEILEVTHLHSLSSDRYEELITARPFRSPHHSSSHISIVGGGATVRPGEVTLSHRGVLFLDEMPEFDRLTLEAMRQPLEDKLITIARAKRTAEYPANFILVATANPCPCGFDGTSKQCRCTPAQILRYRQKLSGPILDRIDLHVAVDAVDHEKLLAPNLASDENDALLLRKRIQAARFRQEKRYSSAEKMNADLTNQEIKTYSQLTDEARSLLNGAAMRLDISARSYMRLVKVARTIADLEASVYVNTPHISEALQYRPIGL